jgi:hypothetical protein
MGYILGGSRARGGGSYGDLFIINTFMETIKYTSRLYRILHHLDLDEG